MNYMKCVGIIYMSVIMASCDAAADSPLKRSLDQKSEQLESTDNCVDGKQESPRDKDQESPRKAFWKKDLMDFRKAIAESSPLRKDSPRIESPRTPRQRSKSIAVIPNKEHRTLSYIMSVEKGISPRVEETFNLINKSKDDSDKESVDSPDKSRESTDLCQSLDLGTLSKFDQKSLEKQRKAEEGKLQKLLTLKEMKKQVDLLAISKGKEEAK